MAIWDRLKIFLLCYNVIIDINRKYIIMYSKALLLSTDHIDLIVKNWKRVNYYNAKDNADNTWRVRPLYFIYHFHALFVFNYFNNNENTILIFVLKSYTTVWVRRPVSVLLPSFLSIGTSEKEPINNVYVSPTATCTNNPNSSPGTRSAITARVRPLLYYYY